MQNIPQAMQSIRQSVTQTVRDLAHAQNEVFALMGQERLPTAGDFLAPDATLPAMLLAVSVEVDATEAAFAELAQFVHGWTTGPAISPEAEARMRARTAELVAALARRPEPLPEPVNAPTLAGGITQPTRIDAADLNAATTSGPEDNPADDVQPTKEEWEAAYPTTDPQPEPEPQPTPEPDGGSEELDAAPGNRVAHLLNGHVEPGKELATVLGATEPEESGGGKKGRNRRKK